MSKLNFFIFRDPHPPFPSHISFSAEDFLFECFKKVPSHRPTAVALLDHHWVRGVRSRNSPDRNLEKSRPDQITFSQALVNLDSQEISIGYIDHPVKLKEYCEDNEKDEFYDQLGSKLKEKFHRLEHFSSGFFHKDNVDNPTDPFADFLLEEPKYETTQIIEKRRQQQNSKLLSTALASLRAQDPLKIRRGLNDLVIAFDSNTTSSFSELLFPLFLPARFVQIRS